MRKTLVLVLAVSVCIGFLKPVQAVDVNDFKFKSFKGEYIIDRQENGAGKLLVRESLVAVFPESDQNHGILRSIPLTYNDYDLDIELISILSTADDNNSYTTYESGGQLVLKIGDADVFVHGEVTYEIIYKLKNMINFTDSNDEFFWDVNGSGWSQSFDSVIAEIFVGAPLSNTLQDEYTCFTGIFGSNERDCSISEVDTDGIRQITISASDLKPFETLTIKVPFDKDTFFQDPWPPRLKKLNSSLIGLVPLITSVVMMRRWQKYGRDPSGRGVIIPQYQPPKDFDALKADVLINERLNTSAISASIIEMATKGYLRLHETQKRKIIRKKTEYKVELLKIDDKLSDNQKTIIEALFGNKKPGSKVNLSTLANKLFATVQKLGVSIPKELSENSFFTREPAKVRNLYIGIGGGMMALAFILGFFKLTLFFGIGLGISGLIVILFANAMPARTKIGVELRDYLVGLKEYMKLAEKDRIKYLQSPEGVKQYGDPNEASSKVNLFETLLPFAMLFGIEKDWAKQFKHLYEQPPDWFNSSTKNFSSLHLANSLGSFNSSTKSAFTPPASSGSSGGSFSGGGGGGGGGGGW